jgi:hypothetical protein
MDTGKRRFTVSLCFFTLIAKLETWNLKFLYILKHRTKKILTANIQVGTSECYSLEDKHESAQLQWKEHFCMASLTIL